MVSGTKASQSLIDFIVNLTEQAGSPIREFDLNELVDKTLIQKNKSGKRVSKAYYPSSIPYMCDVREAFKRVKDCWEDPKVWTVEEIKATEAGTAVHSWFQDGLLGRTGYLWGNWRCRSCGVIYEEQFCPKECCNFAVVTAKTPGAFNGTRHTDCKGAGFDYIELKLIDEEYNIRGRADGVLVFPDRWYILELKSTVEAMINCESREEQEGLIVIKPSIDLLPTDKHVEQASLYVGMVHDLYLDKWPLKKEQFAGALLVYISRETYKIRSFTLPVDTTYYHRVKQRIDTIDELVEKKQPLFGQKICRDRNSWAAKNCPFRLDCFPYKRKKSKNV